MAKKDFIRESTGAVSSPIAIVTTEKTAADWLFSPGANTVAIKDGDGTAVTLTMGAGEVQKGPIREITSSTGKVRYGTGEPPIPSVATAAAASATQAAANAAAIGGPQVQLAQDGAANTAIAETTLGTIAGPCKVLPFLRVDAAVTADDANYATVTIKLYRAGVAIKTWTFTTKITGGSGDLALGSATDFPGGSYDALKGDRVTYTQAKAGTGVQLPARSIVVGLA